MTLLKRVTSLTLALVLLSFAMLISCGNDSPDDTTLQPPQADTSSPETTPEIDNTTTEVPDEPTVDEPNYTSLDLNFNDPNVCTSHFESHGEGALTDIYYA